ncbi:vWA domain-containing protein [Photobacterium sanguinicancri]|uniref:vWA domain-containing protein n=1 Tax=Photobacterium sanguinicancri TaxID=875932 RepID=UPI0024801AE3|nr:VWA domain-containing protein [Photobacterium sanguinicancri]
MMTIFSAWLGASIEFVHPYSFLLLPLPLLVYWFIPAYRTKKTAIKIPFFDTLMAVLGETPNQGASQLTPSWWQRVILIISWLLVITALAKPMILGKPQVREQFGRDVMVVVDLSGSMAETDFVATQDNPEKGIQAGQRISRLAAAKQVLTDFANTRQGDRLGLILFGDAAFLQTPFTADQQAWLDLLQQTDVAMAGQSTHLGDAIGLAIKVFDQTYIQDQDQDQDPSQPAREKVAIVLTDGNDTGSFVEPIEAAKVAGAKGVRIHMVAMGDPATVGEQALDMNTIKRVAALSGGQSFQALNQSELEQAYATIGELEPALYEATTYRPKQTIHHYLISAVVVIYLLTFSILTLKRVVVVKRRKRFADIPGGEQHD